MRLNRTHLVPVLTIVAGGVIGASLSFSFLGRSAAVDVPLARETAEQQLADAVRRRLEPMALETAEQQLADAVRRLEDHAAAMRRAPVGLITLEVPEGYMRLSSFTDWQGLLEVAETYIRLSDFRDEEQQGLLEVAETYIRWSDALQFRSQHFLEAMERQVEVERRRVEFLIASDVTILPNP